MIINVALGSKPDNKRPASAGKIATHLWHATVWASLHEGVVRLLDPKAEDPTLVIETQQRIMPEEFQHLLERTEQYALAHITGAGVNTLRRFEYAGCAPRLGRYVWDDKKFRMPDGRTLAQVLGHQPQPEALPTRRDYDALAERTCEKLEDALSGGYVRGEASAAPLRKED